MKPVRALLFALVILLVLGGVAIGLALTPSVQRWAVMRALRSEPGLKLEVTTVAAGLSHVRLAGVQAAQGGVTIQLESLEADYSPWQLLTSRRLVLGRVRGRGLVVDATRLSPDKTGAVVAGAPAAAPGVLTRIELPFQLVLTDCEIEGRVLLAAAAGMPPLVADYRLTGGRFAPNEEGELVLVATVRNPSSEKSTRLRVEATLRARQTDRRTFDRVGVDALVKAEGSGLSGHEQLKIAANLTRTETGENYTVGVDTFVADKPESVLAIRAVLPQGSQAYAGEWKVAARTAQLEAFFLGAPMPEFNARGEGRFTFNATTFAGSLQGGLEADVRRLEAIEPAWRAIGPVKFVARFDVAQAGEVARLNQLNISLAGEQPVLELAAARAAEINLKERRLLVGGSDSGEALNLTLHGLPMAWVRPFVSSADVSGGMITGQFAITGEPDRLKLRAVQPLRVQGLNVVQAGELLLAKAELTLGFEAVLTNNELTAVVDRFTLTTPAGDSLSVQAKVSLPAVPDPSITVVGTYHADLPTLVSPWLPLGPIKATGEADLTLAGSKLEVRRLQVGVTDASGLDLFNAGALRSFVFDRSTQRAAVAGAAGTVDLIQIAVGRVPLAALPTTRPGTTLGGYVAQGKFIVAVDGDKLTMRSPVPFKLADVALTESGRPALTGLSIEARPLLELTGPGAFKLQSGDLTIRTAEGAALLTAKGEATQSADVGRQGAATFSVEVPALGTQPVFAGARAMTAGRASGEIRAALGRTNQIEARMTVNGLVAASGGDALPVGNLSIRAIAEPDGRIKVDAPLLLDRLGQRSDLNFSLTLTPAGRSFEVDGSLRGEHVELADALVVLGVFSVAAGDAPAQTIGTSRGPAVAPDGAPAWSRFTGRMALDVKSVVQGNDWSMSGLTGLLVIEQADVTLQRLEAAFGDKGRLTAKALLSFTKGETPYELTGDFSLTEFDAGPLFKALDPAKPATIEGIFTVNGKFSGDGGTVAGTLERTRGTFDLTSRAGVFRGLQRTSNKVSMTSKAVELGASVLGSIFGSEKVTKTAEKVAGQAYFVDQLAQSIGELNYDQLSVRISRDDSLNVTLEDVSLVSPEIRLIGKGTVTHVVGKPLLEQPLAASLTFAGRGKIEELLGKLRLLNGAKDELGYAKTRETVTVGGTLAKPDPTAFFTRITTAKLGELLAPEN